MVRGSHWPLCSHNRFLFQSLLKLRCSFETSLFTYPAKARPACAAVAPKAWVVSPHRRCHIYPSLGKSRLLLFREMLCSQLCLCWFAGSVRHILISFTLQREATATSPASSLRLPTLRLHTLLGVGTQAGCLWSAFAVLTALASLGMSTRAINATKYTPAQFEPQ